MIVRFCYAVYLQLLNQHNQEFRLYIPDPLLRGAREGLGIRLHAEYNNNSVLKTPIGPAVGVLSCVYWV